MARRAQKKFKRGPKILRKGKKVKASIIKTGEVFWAETLWSQRAEALNQVISLADDSEDRLILRPHLQSFLNLQLQS